MKIVGIKRHDLPKEKRWMNALKSGLTRDFAFNG